MIHYFIAFVFALLLINLIRTHFNNQRLKEIVIFQSIVSQTPNALSIIDAKSTIWNQYLEIACSTGNTSTINVLISKGANDWCAGLKGAIVGGYEAIAQNMIKRGADNFNEGFYLACRHGKLQIVKILSEKFTGNYMRAFDQACKGDHIFIASYLNHAISVNKAMETAVINGATDIIKLLILVNPKMTLSAWIKSTSNQTVANYLKKYMNKN